MKAIALLEVQAMVAAITGLDAMVKAADVRLIHVEKRLGGRLVTVVVEGEVSAVSAAIEAGAAAAAEVGSVKCKEVIARPHRDFADIRIILNLQIGTHPLAPPRRKPGGGRLRVRTLLFSVLNVVFWCLRHAICLRHDMFACGERVLIEKFLLCKNFSSACYVNGGE